MAFHPSCGLFLAVLTVPTSLFAAGINTDVALTPSAGATIIRTQWRFTQLSNDPTPADREVNRHLFPITAVYGWSERLALIATVPIVDIDIDPDNGSSDQDSGIADIPLMMKYRFYQVDHPGETTRIAAIAGARVPTFDEPFSTESLDPILGAVWSYHDLETSANVDLLYTIGTGGGPEGDDQLKADGAISWLIMGNQASDSAPWGLYAVAEANALYLTDGSVQLLLSPGIQVITSNVIVEAGAQLPVYQDFESGRLETDYTTVLSFRFQF